MDSPLDKIIPSRVDEHLFRDVAFYTPLVEIRIAEDLRSQLYEAERPKFNLVVIIPAKVGRKVQKALDKCQFVSAPIPMSPKKDGQMRWHAMVQFEVGGDLETPEGRELRKQAIQNVWKRIQEMLIEAITGESRHPRPTMRPATRLAKLIH